MKKVITFKNGEKHILHSSNKGNVLVFNNPINTSIEFGENNNWEKSSLKKWLENWWEENAPDDLKEAYNITIPSLANIYSEDELKHYDWVYQSAKVDLDKGEKQWDYFKNPRNRVAFVKDKEYMGSVWYWTKTANRGDAYYVYYVEPTGAYINNCANFSFAVVPACVKK